MDVFEVIVACVVGAFTVLTMAWWVSYQQSVYNHRGGKGLSPYTILMLVVAAYALISLAGEVAGR